MPATYISAPLSSITIDRESRQRKDLGDLTSLADSLSRRGLMNPITISVSTDPSSFLLIAGERRLAAATSLGWSHIDARIYETCSDEEKQILELEENVKREDLSWQERTLALLKIHTICSYNRPDWAYQDTASICGYGPQYISRVCTVARKLLSGDEKIAAQTSIDTAFNLIMRQQNRIIDNELNDMIEAERLEQVPVAISDTAVATVAHQPNVAKTETQLAPPPQTATILTADFHQWSSDYSGRRFNLIHCDFPYGVGIDQSGQRGTKEGRSTGYADSEGVYWDLVNRLCLSLDRLTLPSCHLMFWFSMNFYSDTIAYITKHTDLTLVMPHPLIWHKSDGAGIISDHKRRPRNTYETALLFSRGDRQILTPVHNCYSCPTSSNKALHISEKPEPMLRHFFRMFIDGYSEVLDPTCGGGSAIRAASSLGAKVALGLEQNPDFAAEATTALRKSKNLSTLSEELDL